MQKTFVQMGDINSELSKLCWSFVMLIPTTNESKICFLDFTSSIAQKQFFISSWFIWSK